MPDPSQAQRMMAVPGGGGGQPAVRTAGDVLNDIGSMLADLTDELDAMLHLERDNNPPPPPTPINSSNKNP